MYNKQIKLITLFFNLNLDKLITLKYFKTILYPIYFIMLIILGITFYFDLFIYIRFTVTILLIPITILFFISTWHGNRICVLQGDTIDFYEKEINKLKSK